MSSNWIRPIGVLAAFVSCAFVFGCNDNGPTAPTAAPAARPTPTPVPIPDVAGNWTGRYLPGGVTALCGTEANASARFTQTGPQFSGAVTSPGGGFLAAELRGNQFSGSLRSDSVSRTVTGTASSTGIVIHVGNLFCPNARISLQRSPS